MFLNKKKGGQERQVGVSLTFLAGIQVLTDAQMFMFSCLKS